MTVTVAAAEAAATEAAAEAAAEAAVVTAKALTAALVAEKASAAMALAARQLCLDCSHPIPHCYSSFRQGRGGK